MSFRLIALTTLMLASVFGGEFIEPNPQFLHFFWKTLPAEETAPSEGVENSVDDEKVEEPQRLDATERRFASAPSVASRWFSALAAATFLWALWEVAVLLRQCLFHIRLNGALRRGDASKARFLLQQNLRLPPGITMGEIAQKLDNRQLADRILACEAAKFKKK